MRDIEFAAGHLIHDDGEGDQIILLLTVHLLHYSLSSDVSSIDSCIADVHL